MALGHSPSIVTSGLVLCLDAANYKSFKGTPAINILNSINFNQSNQNNALYKVTNGTESVYIPSLGYVTSKYVDFYNDYNGGSGVCCPNLFSYGTGLVVSPSTTYTYSIIYKTTTGYSHPNYMYRYEYNGSGGYVTESGVHSTNNRTSLGDGWWFAWGQFTTSATTATLNTYLFHYEYATQNRVYVYKAALYQGTYIIRPEHMLNSSENRGSTVATGGGWADIIGNGNHGTLTNGPTYSSDNGGSIVFDGTDDYTTLSSSQIAPGTGAFTWNFWVKLNDLTNFSILFSGTGSNTDYGVIFMDPRNGQAGLGYYALGTRISDNNTSFGSNWWCITFVGSGGANGSRNLKLYRNTIQAGSTYTFDYNFTSTTPNIGANHSSYAELMRGNISNVSYYNRALTASEVQQNFNALRGRFGV